MALLFLTRDTPREIVIEEPRSGPILRAALMAAAAVGVWLIFPSYEIARWMLFAFSLWAASGLLRVHRLHLDIESRAYSYSKGWFLAPPRDTGSFDDITGVFLERHEPEFGAVTSRLRSHRLHLVFGEEFGDRRFDMGFPMSLQLAQLRARDYVQRLDVALVDRSGLGDDEDSEDLPDHSS